MTYRARLFLLPLIAAAAPSQGFQCDFLPTSREVILNTDIQVFTQSNCPPVTVTGGVFLFRSVHIPRGTTVRGIGSRPLIFVVAGDVVIDGEITVNGGDGTSVAFRNAANMRVIGGGGECGGGRGGEGSPSQTDSSVAGETGFGPGKPSRQVVQAVDIRAPRQARRVGLAAAAVRLPRVCHGGRPLLQGAERR